MKLSGIANIRLSSQQIEGTKFKSSKEMVGWMGAMQAQDYQMSKWAIGVRLPDSTDKEIEAAIDKGQIIRTHILRPTWHLISADDIYWMLELTEPHIRTTLNAYSKSVGLNETILTKCHKIFEKVLVGNNHLTRDELMALLNKAKIPTDGFRSMHIMFHAEINGLVCSGAKKGKSQTYALLEERVKKTKSISRDEALAKLAQRYFLSHGPATVKDFAWWSGLPMKDARNAIEMVKSNFISETIDSETYWFKNVFSLPTKVKPSVYLLPAFDEFLISYKDRTASFPLANHKKAFTSNGIFRPVIVIDGNVAGIWKRSIKKDTVIMEIDYFQRQNKPDKVLIEKAVKRYGLFLDSNSILRQ